MLTTEELKILLNDLESDRVERTRSTNKIPKFSEAICAFANDLPNSKKSGYLIIGVDEQGVSTGITVTDELLTTLGGLRSDGNIQPLPCISVRKEIIDGGEIAIVEVQPSYYTPVRYSGTIWIRVGPRKAKASEQEERVLIEKRISHVHSFDSSAANGSNLTDLSLALFNAYQQEVIDPDIIKANHRTIENQLATLRFYDTHYHCATNAGLLLFGINPLYFLPGAYIQYLKLSGTQLTDDILDQAKISGDLLSILRELDIRVRSQLQSTLEKISVLREEMFHDYPEKALRELLMNAVMHRDYQSHTPIKFHWFSDRIEIQSPGGLYGIAAIDKLETTSDYRNPVIAESMKGLGYVNRYGVGIQQAQASLTKNGNPKATFTCNGNAFLATIRKRIT